MFSYQTTLHVAPSAALAFAKLRRLRGDGRPNQHHLSDTSLGLQ